MFHLLRNESIRPWVSAIYAIGIYLFTLIGIWLYFTSHNKDHNKNFVEKNEESISVSISLDIPQEVAPASVNQPSNLTPSKPQVSKPKPPIEQPKAVEEKAIPLEINTTKIKKIEPKKEEPKKEEPKKEEPKKEEPKKEEPKKEEPKKEEPKKEEPKKEEPKKEETKPKHSNPNDLFANIGTPTKPTNATSPVISTTAQRTDNTSTTGSATAKVNEHMGSGERGIEDAYKARIIKALEGWPTQAEYAGQMAKVEFKVFTSGQFEFVLKQKSTNEDFNRGLIQYLEQLQNVGFGPHNSGRTLTIDVDFIAKD